MTRIVLRNYKSIAACDVSPAQLCFLVGPNGSGKSNFLDAIRFVADALRFSPDHALISTPPAPRPRSTSCGGT
jgi:predicted ATPase